jgi:hypothetical protein
MVRGARRFEKDELLTKRLQATGIRLQEERPDA